MADSRRETSSVTHTESTSDASSPALAPSMASPERNAVKSVMSSGKRPLHGTRLFVSIAMSRSRGESMMRQPVTPQALQPRPMHIVRLCRPCAPARAKQRSSTNATRGR